MKKNLIIIIPILLLIIYFPLFLHLGSMPIELWDESRLAINAIEMQKSGDFLVTTYMGEPDMWNTKPPFLIWCQVLFLNFIHSEELAIRLPSAIAGAGTVILLFSFCYRYLKSISFGFITAVILVSSAGFVSSHVTRTGDYDALLVFFLTLYSLLFFTYVKTKKIKYLYLFFCVIPLAVLTKSVAGLFLLPGCFLFLLFEKSLVPILKNKHTYIGLAIAIIPIVSYYFIREQYNPGYWEAVQLNELGGRYNIEEDVNKSSVWYYWNQIIKDRYSYFFILIPVGLFFGFTSASKKIKQLTTFLTCMILPFFIIISFAKTRLFWYDAPLYPFFALSVAIILHHIYQLLHQHKIAFNRQLNWVGILFLVVILMQPYSKVVGKSYKPTHDISPEVYDAYFRANFYFKKGLKEEVELDGYKFIHEGYNANQEFYILLLQNKGVDISLSSVQDIKVGNHIIIDQKSVDQKIQTHFKLDTLYKDINLKKYQIIGTK